MWQRSQPCSATHLTNRSHSRSASHLRLSLAGSREWWWRCRRSQSEEIGSRQQYSGGVEMPDLTQGCCNTRSLPWQQTVDAVQRREEWKLVWDLSSAKPAKFSLEEVGLIAALLYSVPRPTSPRTPQGERPGKYKSSAAQGWFHECSMVYKTKICGINMDQHGSTPGKMGRFTYDSYLGSGMILHQQSWLSPKPDRV